MENPENIEVSLQLFIAKLRQKYDLSSNLKNGFLDAAKKLVIELLKVDDDMNALLQRIDDAGYSVAVNATINPTLIKKEDVPQGIESLPPLTWASGDNDFLKQLHISIVDDPFSPKE